MPLPAPTQIAESPESQQARVKITIANITNSHLRELVIMYDARKNQTAPLAVAEGLWGNISWVWANARAEAEETIKKHVQATDLDAWIVEQYEADVAKYTNVPVPSKTT